MNYYVDHETGEVLTYHEVRRLLPFALFAEGTCVKVHGYPLLVPTDPPATQTPGFEWCGRKAELVDGEYVQAWYEVEKAFPTVVDKKAFLLALARNHDVFLKDIVVLLSDPKDYQHMLDLQCDQTIDFYGPLAMKICSTFSFKKEEMKEIFIEAGTK